jgi:DHA1 family tetracycline resistance protein-like MFS transporter
MKSSPYALFILFLVVFLDLLGIGIIIPVLSPLILNGTGDLVPSHWNDATRSHLLGFLIASYPLAQFFGAPVLGKLSDRFGRKKILTVSLFGTMLGYLLFGFGVLSENLWLLFASRILDGFTGGNIAVANSAIADLSPDPQTRAKNFGMIGMAFGFGFVMGPALGGLLSDPSVLPWFGPAVPFWFAAGLSAMNLVFVAFFFKESLQNKVWSRIRFFMGFHNIAKGLRMPKLRALFAVIFLHAFGFAFFTQFFPVYLVQKFGFEAKDIGLFFAYVGVWIAFSQGVLNRLAVNRFSSERILKWGFPLLALSIASVALPSVPLWLWLAQPLVAIFEGLVFPNLTTMVSKISSADEQGEVLGITQSLRALAESLPPIIAGFIVVINVHLPTLTSASIIALAGLMYFLFFKPART